MEHTMPTAALHQLQPTVHADRPTGPAIEEDAIRDHPGAGLARGIVAGLAMEVLIGVGLFAVWLAWDLVK